MFASAPNPQPPAATAAAINCNVLVLNKHYMPLRIVGVKRAFSLLCRRLAEVIHIEDGNYLAYDFASWLKSFENFCKATKVQNDVLVSQLEFHLVHHAEAFYFSQPTDVRDDYTRITQAMKDRFHGKSDLTN